MQRFDPAIARLLEPGDRIVAGLRASDKGRRIAALVTGTLLPAAWFVVAVLTRDVLVALVVLVAVAGVNVAVQSRQKVYFLGVTQRQVICRGLSHIRGRPTRLAFSAPLATVTVHAGSDSWLGRTVRFSGPGVRPQGMQLIVGPRSGDYLDLLLSVAGERGASVPGAARGTGQNDEFGQP